MNIAHDNKCDFCQESKDSIEHVFWRCTHVQFFWKRIADMLKSKCTTCTNITLTQNLILFGTDDIVKTDSVLDLIILLGKNFIYKCKFDKCLPTIQSFENYLTVRYKIEKHNAKLKCSLNEFERQCFPYIPLSKSRTEN